MLVSQYSVLSSTSSLVGDLPASAVHCAGAMPPVDGAAIASKLSEGNQPVSWQEWQGSNLQPPVLETGALPIELHSCKTCVAADPGRFKHRAGLKSKGEADSSQGIRPFAGRPDSPVRRCPHALRNSQSR